MFHANIRPLQRQLESRAEAVLADWDAAAIAGELSVERLTGEAGAQAEALVTQWWQLADRLIAKYLDGYVSGNLGKPQNPAAVAVGYSAEWLARTDYPQGPVSYKMRLVT